MTVAWLSVAADAPAGPPAWQTWLPTFLGVVITACGGIVAAVWVKRLNRRLDDAAADKSLSESRKADAETVSIEVATARGLIADIKAMMSEQKAEFTEQRAELSARSAEQAERIKELSSQFAENREQLRAIRSAFASHEMWDRDAVAALRQSLPNFPDPPPVNFD